MAITSKSIRESIRLHFLFYLNDLFSMVETTFGFLLWISVVLDCDGWAPQVFSQSLSALDVFLTKNLRSDTATFSSVVYTACALCMFFSVATEDCVM